MALSRELLKRLNSDDEPLRKRIKLAENTFYASDLPLVRREDLILNWLCKICLDDQEAWDALECCLKQDQLDIKDQVKQSLIDIVVQSLTEKPVEESNEYKLLDFKAEPSENLMRYCKLLVSNPTMQQYFAREPKAFICLVESALTSTYKFFKRIFSEAGQTNFSKGIDIGEINERGGMILNIYTDLINIVEAMLQIYKISYSTKEELKSAFLESILYPLCKIVDHKCFDNTNRLGTAAHKCIQQLIFGKKNAQSKSQEGKDDTYQRLLLKLEKNIENTDLESNMLVFVSVFRAAIGLFKDDTFKLDVIFRGLVDSAGIHNKKVMSLCLKCMQDITFDFDQKVNDVTLFAYCQKNVDDMLLQEKLAHSDLKLVTQLAYFNPLIIERKIPEILKKILLKKRTASWNELVLAILDASVRLRKEEKFASQLLIALRGCLAEEGPHLQLEQFFASEFIEKFTKTANNITGSQTVVILRTLIYHLNTDCIQILESQDFAEKVSMMQATVELLTAFFNGICIFEYKGTLDWHKKFINALDELGNMLAVSVDKALQQNYNETITELLLNAMESWSKIQAALGYYVPKIVEQKSNDFPISEDHWQQLVQRVANFGPDQSRNMMNRLIIRKGQALESATSDCSIKLSGLIGGIENFWPFLLQHNTEIVSCLKASELTKLASLVLDEMMLDKEKYDYWLNVLKSDHIHECRSFVLLLLCNALIKIGKLLPEGSVKNIIACMKVGHMMAAEFDGCNKIQEDMKEVRKLLNFKDSYLISTAVSKKIRSILNLLSNLPLAFLTGDVRAFTFLIICIICELCYPKHGVKQRDACFVILSDLIDRPGINVCRYVKPRLYMDSYLKSEFTQTAIELSLRKGLSEKCLTKLSRSCECLRDMCLLMKCIENVKPKVNAKKRQTIKKVEEELVDKILPYLDDGVTTQISHIEATMAVVKYSLSTGNLCLRMDRAIKYAITAIFVERTIFYYSPEFMEPLTQLAVIILRNRKTFDIWEFPVMELWRSMLDFSNNNLLLTLAEFTEKDDFPEVLQKLHTWSIESLSNVKYVSKYPRQKENREKNISAIWKAVLTIDMSSEKNKMRLAAIVRLLEAVQSLDISEKTWLIVLKLLCNIANAKHLHLSGSIVDATLQLGMRSVDEVKLAACDDALALCSILVRHRTSLIIDRLPILLQFYKQIIMVVTMTSKTSVDMPTEYTLKSLAINIEKITGALIKMRKDLLRLAPYLIADLLELFADATIPYYVKGSLQNCISQLISVCDQHGIALLSRTLPLSMQAIFKTQMDTFNKFYKFSGKI